jgi:hypothetical protein
MQFTIPEIGQFAPVPLQIGWPVAPPMILSWFSTEVTKLLIFSSFNDLFFILIVIRWRTSAVSNAHNDTAPELVSVQAGLGSGICPALDHVLLFHFGYEALNGQLGQT